jgi:putative hydrolase of the HAD superfamily
MKVLMVDVDGVLINGRPDDGLPLFTFLERDLGLSAPLLQQAFFKPHWPDIIVGREAMIPRLGAVLAEIAPHIGADQLADYWFRNDARLDPALLKSLAARRETGVRIFLATNQEHGRARYMMETLGLAAHVDGILYSAALGHAKPAMEFFRLANETAGVAPDDIVFLDDKPENVEAAETFGWRAIHWQWQMDLEAALAVRQAIKAEAV